MNRSISYFALREALPEPGCAVCRLKAKATEQYLDGLLWESVNDPGVRNSVRQAQGFCHEHAWRLVRHGGSLGTAILLRDVLQDVLGALQQAHAQDLPSAPQRRALRTADPGRRPTPAGRLLARLTPTAGCPACAYGQQMEGIHLDILVNQLLGEDGLLELYEASDGLCLPHLREAISRAPKEAALAIINAQARIWERLLAQLSEFIRKSDYRFRGEAVGEEGDSWLRAISALAGAPRGSEG